MRASVETLWQVKLQGGKVWTGTEQELRQKHPIWVKYAKPYQPEPQELITREDMEAAGMDFLDDPRPGRLGNSARRYAQPSQPQVEYEYRDTVVQTKIPPRRSVQRQPHPNLNRAQPPDVIHAPAARRDTEEDDIVRPKRQRRRWHPLWYLGIGMIVMLLLWQGGMALGNWWKNTRNDMTYTQAFRTYSVDMAVGHNHDSASNPSHFIVQNDKRHVVIIEFPADDPAKALIYTAPTIIGDGGDRTPVTISFQRNPHTGRLDMVLHIEDQQYVFTNNGTKFVPPSGQ